MLRKCCFAEGCLQDLFALLMFVCESCDPGSLHPESTDPAEMAPSEGWKPGVSALATCLLLQVCVLTAHGVSLEHDSVPFNAEDAKRSH